MNCKQGDLAIVVANNFTVLGGYCGVPIRVTVLHTNRAGEPSWEYEGRKLVDREALRLSRELRYPDDEATVNVIPDAWLRPLSGDPVAASDDSEAEALGLYDAPKVREGV